MNVVFVPTVWDWVDVFFPSVYEEIVAHAKSVPPEFVVKTWLAEPLASLTNLVPFDFKISPAAVEESVIVLLVALMVLFVSVVAKASVVNWSSAVNRGRVIVLSAVVIAEPANI